MEERACPPGLWAAAHQVFAGAGMEPRIPGEAAKKLRDTVVGEAHACLDHTLSNPLRLSPVAVAAHTGGDDRVVVGPDRPVVIAHRVEAGGMGRERTDAPAREHVRRHEPGHDLLSSTRIHDAGPQTVARVAGDRLDLALVAVEGLGVKTRLRHPVAVLEPAAQLIGLSLEAVS